MAEPVRLFVGGIPGDISIEDISARFAPFGAVAGVERAPVKLHQSPLGTDPNDCRGFAYVDLVPLSDSSVSKCCTAVRGVSHAVYRSFVDDVNHAFTRNYIVRIVFPELR